MLAQTLPSRAVVRADRRPRVEVEATMLSPSSRLTGRSRARHRRHRVVATEPEPRKCLADLLRDDPGKLVQLGATRRWQRVEDRAVRVHAVEKQRVQVRVEVE